MYMYINTAEQLQLHKAVIFLLIMKHYLIKNGLILIQLYQATLSKSGLPIVPLKEYHSYGILTTLRLRHQRLMHGINAASWQYV